MTTKKQRHEEALKKRESMLEEVRQTGLAAQETDRKKRAVEIRDAWRDTHESKHFKFIKECPLCEDSRREMAEKNRSSAIKSVAKAGAKHA
jgi:hypothetical protein